MNRNFIDLLNSENYPNSPNDPNSQSNPNSPNLQNYQNNPNTHHYPNSLNNPTFQNYLNPQSLHNISNFSNNPNFQSFSQIQNFHAQVPNQISPSEPSPSLTTKPSNPKKKREPSTWREKEDEALMSAWCMVSTNPILGKNQGAIIRWKKVKEIYDQSHLENPDEIGNKSVDAMRSRYRRLNEYVNKWVACYKEVLSRPRKSGTNMEDVENAAQQLYAADNNGNKFTDLKVFNNVMSKHPKWSIEQAGVQQIEINEEEAVEIESGGSSKRSRPNEQDLARLLEVGQQRGFPGMLGSIDCTHWEWKNCPSAWAGQFAGRSTKTTIILEAVASHDLWIWHAFFGTPGSCNDINVLQRSPVFNDILEGRAPEIKFIVNGRQYNKGYYLTDGIYPSWATFVKSITAPQLRKHKLFAQYQEAARKDVERAFGVLQARFAFIKRPCLIWDDRLMGKILMTCIIMHNMIVEDERGTYLNHWDTTEFNEDMVTRENTTNGVGDDNGEGFQFSTTDSSLRAYMQRRSQLRDRNTHDNLKSDLIEHIWEKFGNVN